MTMLDEIPLIEFKLGDFSNIWEFYDDTDGDRLQVKLNASYEYHESYPEDFEKAKKLHLAFNNYERLQIENNNNLPKNVKMKIVIYLEDEEND